MRRAADAPHSIPQVNDTLTAELAPIGVPDNMRAKLRHRALVVARGALEHAIAIRKAIAARPNASNARACLPIIQLKFTSECFDGAPSLRREAEVAAAQRNSSRHGGPHTGPTAVQLSAERHNRFFWAAETPSWSTCADPTAGARSGRQRAPAGSAKKHHHQRTQVQRSKPKKSHK